MTRAEREENPEIYATRRKVLFWGGIGIVVVTLLFAISFAGSYALSIHTEKAQNAAFLAARAAAYRIAIAQQIKECKAFQILSDSSVHATHIGVIPQYTRRLADGIHHLFVSSGCIPLLHGHIPPRP